MEIGGLKIVLKETFLVKDMLELQRVNEKLEKEKIDQVDFQNELLHIGVISVNGEISKEKKLELLGNMENINDFVKLVETVAENMNKQHTEKKKK